jgi:hypothetical protein
MSDHLERPEVSRGEQMLKFNTLLQESGFDPNKVFLLRHEDKRSRISLYQAWKSQRQDFETYQRGQKWKNRFPVGFSLAAFVVGPERETLFVGIYDVMAVSQKDGQFVDPLIGEMPDEKRSWHDLRRSDRMLEYEERVVIEWGPGKLAWRQRANEQNKTVLEIRARANEPTFPHYIEFLRRLGALENIYPSWQRRLEEAKGIYLLTFDDGTQYVGSATGQDGFWQRWQNYLANGHGGNKVLIRDRRDARTAMVSILEVSGSADTDQDIINREMIWKQKLGVKAKPLDVDPGMPSPMTS